MNNIQSDQEKTLILDIPKELREEYHPVLDMALFALTKILQNDHMQKNFSTHFIPIEFYQYDFPVEELRLKSKNLAFSLQKDIPESILLQIKQVFTEENLPRVIFQEDSQMFAMGDCSIYGLYNGRSREEDENKIYINKDV